MCFPSKLSERQSKKCCRRFHYDDTCAGICLHSSKVNICMNETIVGTCMQMCPASELDQHNNRNFEINPVTKEFDPSFAIKTFHRSDAGKKILASDIRPLPVLQKTMNHIINVVIGQLVGLTPGATEWNMAKFVRDIFRSIRQDITIQNLKGIEVIDIDLILFGFE